MTKHGSVKLLSPFYLFLKSKLPPQATLLGRNISLLISIEVKLFAISEYVHLFIYLHSQLTVCALISLFAQTLRLILQTQRVFLQTQAVILQILGVILQTLGVSLQTPGIIQTK